MSSELYLLLSKLVPLIVLPPGIVITALLVALVLLRMKRFKAAAVSVAVSALILIICSMPVVASFLYGQLEQEFPPLELADVPIGDCIVVLGGIVGPAIAPRVDIELTDGVDRAYKAVELFAAGKGRLVIIAAGNQPWSGDQPPEAELIKMLLTKWGVPETAVVMDRASRNTRENALISKGLIEKFSCETTLLVTSAAHMPRANAAFAKVGVSVFPVSTDVRIVDRNKMTLLDFFPRADALSMTSDAVREWMGQKVYEYRDWN